jgi:hypothetical protein
MCTKVIRKIIFYLFNVIIFLVGSYSTVKAQQTVVTMTYSVSPYPSNTYSAGYGHFTITLHIENYHYTSCKMVFHWPLGTNVTTATFNPSFNGPLPSIEPGQNLLISAPYSGDYTGDLNIEVEVTGCQIISTASFLINSQSICTNCLPISSSTIYFTSLNNCGDVPTLNNPCYNDICVPIDKPFVGMDITNMPVGASTHNDQNFLRYDVVDRYYKIVPKGAIGIGGITEFFKLKITPELGIKILRIDAVNNISLAPIFPAISTTPFTNSSPQTFTFNPSDISTYNTAGSHPYLECNDGDYILIRERIQIIDMENCIPTFVDDKTDYQFEAHYDHVGPPGPACYAEHDYLNVRSREMQPPNISVRIINDQDESATSFPQLSGICPNDPYGTYPANSVEYSALVTNNGVSTIPDNALTGTGWGTIELTQIKMELNPDYFTFDDVEINGVPITGNYSYVGGVLTINTSNLQAIASSITTLNGPHLRNNLTNSIFNSGPIPNSYNGTNYTDVFLPEGNTFIITLHHLRYTGCENGHEPPEYPYSFTALQTGTPRFHVFYKTQCEMNLPVDATIAQPTDLIDNWQVSNYFSGTAYSDPVASTLGGGDLPQTADLSFMYVPSGDVTSGPWSLYDNMAHNLIPCPNGYYYAVITMTDYYSIQSNSTTIGNPNSVGGFPITPVLQIPSPPGTNQYIVTWDNSIGLINPAYAQINFTVLITCPLAASNNWIDNVTLEFRSVCDPACTTCYRSYGTAVRTLMNHCNGLCGGVSQVRTDLHSYYLNRITFGWTDQNAFEANPSVPDINETTLNSLGTDFLITPADKASFYECDILKTYCKGNTGSTETNASASTLTIALGTQNLTVNTGLNFVAGQTVSIINSATGYMTGVVTSYSSGTGVLIVNVTSVTGTGTFSTWNVTGSTTALPVGSTNFAFEIAYMAPPGAPANFFDFQSGTFTISCLALNTSWSIPVTPSNASTYTIVGGMFDGFHAVRITPDPNALDVSTSISLIAGLTQKPCTLQFEGYYKVFATGVTGGTYCNIFNAGQFIYTDPSLGQQSSCDPGTDCSVFYKIEPAVNWADVLGPRQPDWITTSEACEIRFALQTSTYGGSGNTPTNDDFPHEYRPVFDWPDNLAFDVPTSEYVMLVDNPDLDFPTDFTRAAYLDLTGLHYISPSDISISTVDATTSRITLSNLRTYNNYRDRDRKGYATQGIELFLTRLCSTFDNPLGIPPPRIAPSADLRIDNSNPPTDVAIFKRAYINTTQYGTLCTTCSSGDNICRSNIPICSTPVCSYNYNSNPPQPVDYPANPEIFEMLVNTNPPIPQSGDVNPNTIQLSFIHYMGAYYAGTMENTWVYFIPPAGVTVDLQTTIGGIVPSIVNGTSRLYKLGTINGATPLNYNLVYHFSGACSSIPYDQFAIQAFYGNSCDGYEQLIAAPIGDISDFTDQPCIYNTFNITVQPQQASLAMGPVTVTQPSGGCGVYCDFDVASIGAGNVSDAIIHYFNNPAQGFSLPNFANSTVRLPAGSPIGLNSLGFNLTSAWQQLTSSSTLFNNGAIIHYHIWLDEIITSCIPQNLSFTFQASGNQPCNDGNIALSVFSSIISGTLATYQPCGFHITMIPHGPCPHTGITTGHFEIQVQGGTGPYTYSMPPCSTVTTNNANYNSCTVSADGVTVYTVTVTDNATGCTRTASSTLSASPNILIDDTHGEPPHCIGGSDGYATVTASGGAVPLTYAWSPAGGTSSSTTPLASGQYSVIITDANGCSVSTNVTIPDGSPDCCGNASSQLIPTDGNINQGTYQNATMGLSYNAIVATGTTVIFNHLELLIAHDKSITVQSGATLNVVGTSGSSILHACGDMWTGIIVEPGGTLLIDNSTIEDAITGVFNDGGTTSANGITISHSQLLQNYVGVQLNNYGTSPFQIYSTLISGTTLTKAPHSGDHAEAGIWLNHSSSILVGKTTSISYANTIEDVNYGIYSFATNLTVKNCKFMNITASCQLGGGDEGYVCDHPSYGIYADNDNSNFSRALIVGGATVPQRCNFLNCTNGIFATRNYVSNITHNSFTIDNAYPTTALPGTQGIQVEHHENCNQTISWNSFNNYFQGITLLDIQMTVADIGGIAVNINSNTFNNNTSTFINEDAIRILYSNSPLNCSFTTSGNTIYSYKHGINAVYVDHDLLIQGNHIYLSATPPQNGQLSYYGVRVQNTLYGLKVDNNRVERLITNDPTCAGDANCNLRKIICGISIEKCGEAVVTNNYTIKTGNGIRFYQENTAPHQVTCNHLEHCLSGVSIEGSQSTGYNLGNQGTLTESEDNQWISIANTANRYSTIYNQINSNGVGTAPTWYVESGVYDPGTCGNCIVSAFSIIPILATNHRADCYQPCDPPCWQLQVYAIVARTREYQNLTDNAWYAAQVYAFKVLASDTKLMSLGTQYDAPLVHFYDSVMSKNPGLFQQVTNLVADDDTVTAEIVNSNIEPKDLSETNQQLVNDIYIRTWGRKNYSQFTEDDVNTLLNIAYQNPVSGGTAVYMARVMMNMNMDDFWDDDQQRLTSSQSLSDEQIGKIIPNPNNGKMQFVYKLADDEKGMLQIYSVKGQLVKFYSLHPDQLLQDIDLTGADCGLYFCRLTVNDVIKSSNKIIIER